MGGLKPKEVSETLVVVELEPNGQRALSLGLQTLEKDQSVEAIDDETQNLEDFAVQNFRWANLEM